MPHCLGAEPHPICLVSYAPRLMHVKVSIVLRTTMSLIIREQHSVFEPNSGLSAAQDRREMHEDDDGCQAG
jgi:hypothetical protein